MEQSSTVNLTPELADVAQDRHALGQLEAVHFEDRYLSVRQAYCNVSTAPNWV